jgi:hypothetical protein
VTTAAGTTPTTTGIDGVPILSPASLRRLVNEAGITISPLVYDYTTLDWYREPMSLRKDRWSLPYFDEGGGNIWMVTYAVPFRRGKRLAGVVTLDLRYDHKLRLCFSSQSAKAAEVTCTFCGLGTRGDDASCCVVLCRVVSWRGVAWAVQNVGSRATPSLATSARVLTCATSVSFTD